MSSALKLVCLFFSEVTNLQEESSTVQSLKDEFTQRIAEAERKAQLACKERDIAKKVLESVSMSFLAYKSLLLPLFP